MKEKKKKKKSKGKKGKRRRKKVKEAKKRRSLLRMWIGDGRSPWKRWFQRHASRIGIGCVILFGIGGVLALNVLHVQQRRREERWLALRKQLSIAIRGTDADVEDVVDVIEEEHETEFEIGTRNEIDDDDEEEDELMRLQKMMGDELLHWNDEMERKGSEEEKAEGLIELMLKIIQLMNQEDLLKRKGKKKKTMIRKRGEGEDDDDEGELSNSHHQVIHATVLMELLRKFPGKMNKWMELFQRQLSNSELEEKEEEEDSRGEGRIVRHLIFVFEALWRLSHDGEGGEEGSSLLQHRLANAKRKLLYTPSTSSTSSSSSSSSSTSSYSSLSSSASHWFLIFEQLHNKRRRKGRERSTRSSRKEVEDTENVRAEKAEEEEEEEKEELIIQAMKTQKPEWTRLDSKPIRMGLDLDVLWIGYFLTSSLPLLKRIVTLLGFVNPPSYSSHSTHSFSLSSPPASSRCLYSPSRPSPLRSTPRSSSRSFQATFTSTATSPQPDDETSLQLHHLATWSLSSNIHLSKLPRLISDCCSLLTEKRSRHDNHLPEQVLLSLKVILKTPPP
jgi:hypothetical protein